MPLHVVRAGPRTTIQDLGRSGVAHLGIPRAGAVDRDSHRLANRAVGNRAEAATLEITLGGVELRADGDLKVAVAGASAAVTVGGATVEPGVATPLSHGDILRIDHARVGVYVYLAVAGGVVTAPVLGSRSTDTLTGLGPPPLRDGGRIEIGDERGQSTAVSVPEISSDPLPVTPGPHADRLPGALAAFTEGVWMVTPSADRTALRLRGDRLPAGDLALPSEALVEGAVQLPPDGQPLVFLANHPTTGGYPVIAVVRSAQVGRLAQSRPGISLRFTT